MSGKTYWLTLAIEDEELAEQMGCTVEEIENGDYLGAIRKHAEIVKLEEIDS